MEDNDKLILLNKSAVKTKDAELVESRRPVEFEVKYERGHSTKESWEYTNLHCPSCGEQSVWMDSGPGDVEAGNEHLCTKCETSFHMPFFRKADNYEDKQRLEAIRKWE